MQIDKIKRKAKIVMSNSKKLNANFFLSQHSASHSGGETVFDIVNSQNSFIPLEDNLTKDITVNFFIIDHFNLNPSFIRFYFGNIFTN